jgi:hypothetical protein
MKKAKKEAKSRSRKDTIWLTSDSDDSTKEFGTWLTKHKSHCAIPTRKKGRPNRPPLGTYEDEKTETPKKTQTAVTTLAKFNPDLTSTCTWTSIARQKPVVTSKNLQPKLEEGKVVTPRLSESKKKKARNYFDLTDESEEKMLLPGARYETIRTKHSLFFSYDPRGSTEADERYCVHCKCPKNYCSDIVVAPFARKQCELWIDDAGGVKDKRYTGDTIFYNFNRCYAYSLFYKMRENNIEVPRGYDDTEEDHLYRVPMCVQKGTFKKMLTEMRKIKEIKFVEPTHHLNY